MDSIFMRFRKREGSGLPGFIDHIDLRVKDGRRSTPFYDAFMGALGLQRITDDDDADEGVGYAYEDAKPHLHFFGLIPEPDHRPDTSRIAFAAGSKEAVDRVSRAVVVAGAKAVEGPGPCPECGRTSSAVFFEDEEGNRFEVCCRNASLG